MESTVINCFNAQEIDVYEFTVQHSFHIYSSSEKTEMTQTTGLDDGNNNTNNVNDGVGELDENNASNALIDV